MVDDSTVISLFVCRLRVSWPAQSLLERVCRYGERGLLCSARSGSQVCQLFHRIVGIECEGHLVVLILERFVSKSKVRPGGAFFGNIFPFTSRVFLGALF